MTQPSEATEQQDWVASWTLVQSAPEPDSQGRETEAVDFVYETGQAEQPRIPQVSAKPCQQSFGRLAKRHGAKKLQLPESDCRSALAGGVCAAPGQRQP